MFPSFGTHWWLGEGGGRGWGRSALAAGAAQLQRGSASSRAELLVRGARETLRRIQMLWRHGMEWVSELRRAIFYCRDFRIPDGPA